VTEDGTVIWNALFSQAAKQRQCDHHRLSALLRSQGTSTTRTPSILPLAAKVDIRK